RGAFGPYLSRSVVQFDHVLFAPAELGDGLDRAAPATARLTRTHVDIGGAEGQRDALSVTNVVRHGHGDLRSPIRQQRTELTPLQAFRAGWQVVDASEEVHHEARGGLLVNLARRAGLLDS